MVVAEKKNYFTYNQYSMVEKYDSKKNNFKKNSKKKKTVKAIRTLLGVMVFFILGFVIVLRFALLTDMASTLDKQKKKLSGLEKTKSQLQTEVTIDLKTVDDIAKNKLGMDRPYKYQIVYVDLSKNSTNIAVENSSEIKPKFEIVNKINKMVEYLY